MNTTVSSQQNFRKGLLFSLCATTLVSSNFISVKFSQTEPGGFNANTFSLMWLSVASVLSLGAILFSGQWRELAIPKKHIVRFALFGLTSGVGVLLAWTGLRHLDPPFAAFIWRFFPVMSILLGTAFLRERLTGWEVLAVVTMVSGGVLSAWKQWDVKWLGLTLTLAAALCAAILNLLAKSLVKEFPPNVLLFYRNFLGALIIAAWVIPLGRLDFHVDSVYYGTLLFGCLVGPFAGMMMFFNSYRHWDLTRTSIVHTGEPLLVLVWAYLFMDMFPRGNELLGGALILLGALWLAILHLKHRKSDSALTEKD